MIWNWKKEYRRIKAIDDHIRQKGYPPSFNEVAELWGCSYNGAREACLRYRDKGYIDWPFYATRKMSVTDKGEELIRLCKLKEKAGL